MFDLTGKCALVTGAGRGVGAGIARTLARQGASVAVNDFSPERAEETRDAIIAAGGKSIAVPFDVTDFAAVSAGFANAADAFGPVDILVNNAGNGGAGGKLKIDQFRNYAVEDWQAPIAVNLFGVLNCCKAAIDSMVDRGWGRIVTMSSGSGTHGDNIGVSTYAAGKGGAISFMRHLAIENAGTGVTCNTVALGLFNQGDAVVDKLSGRIPVKRIGKPEDAGYLCVYLVSDEAEWMTGQTIPLNGGSSTT